MAIPALHEHEANETAANGPAHDGLIQPGLNTFNRAILKLVSFYCSKL